MAVKTTPEGSKDSSPGSTRGLCRHIWSTTPEGLKKVGACPEPPVIKAEGRSKLPVQVAGYSAGVWVCLLIYSYTFPSPTSFDKLRNHIPGEGLLSSGKNKIRFICFPPFVFQRNWSYSTQACKVGGIRVWGIRVGEIRVIVFRSCNHKHL